MYLLISYLFILIVCVFNTSSKVIEADIPSRGLEAATQSESLEAELLGTDASVFQRDVLVKKLQEFSGVYRDFPYSMVQGSDGARYITGSFDQSMKLGDFLLESHTGTNIFLTKIDADGNVVWAAQSKSSDEFGDRGGSVAYDLAIDPKDSSIVIVGMFTQRHLVFGDIHLNLVSSAQCNAFVARYSNDGQAMAAQMFEADDCQYAKTVMFANSGHFYVHLVGGFYVGKVTMRNDMDTFDLLPTKTMQGWFARFDKSSQPQWVITLNCESNAFVNDMSESLAPKEVGGGEHVVRSLDVNDGDGDERRVVVSATFAQSLNITMADSAHTVLARVETTSTFRNVLLLAVSTGGGMVQWYTSAQTTNPNTCEQMHRVQCDSTACFVLGCSSGDIEFAAESSMSSEKPFMVAMSLYSNYYVARFRLDGSLQWAHGIEAHNLDTYYAALGLNGNSGEVVMASFLQGTVKVGNMLITEGNADVDAESRGFGSTLLIAFDTDGSFLYAAPLAAGRVEPTKILAAQDTASWSMVAGFSGQALFGNRSLSSDKDATVAVLLSTFQLFDSSVVPPSQLSHYTFVYTSLVVAIVLLCILFIIIVWIHRRK